jgi:hypothetical protein
MYYCEILGGMEILKELGSLIEYYSYLLSWNTIVFNKQIEMSSVNDNWPFQSAIFDGRSSLQGSPNLNSRQALYVP